MAFCSHLRTYDRDLFSVCERDRNGVGEHTTCDDDANKSLKIQFLIRRNFF